MPPVDHFPSTHATWIGTQLTIIEGATPDGPAARTAHRSVATYLMERYREPLRAYVVGSALRELGEPDELVAGFFAHMLATPDSLLRWRTSGLQLRRWLNLMLFASRADDHRAAMLLSRVAVRARSMELLAREAGLDRSDQELAFMAGMFSLLGVLFGLPLPEVFKPLQISEVLVAAVLHRQGPIGQLLQTVEGVERGDATGLQNLPGGLVLTPVQFSLLHLGAFQWMLGIVRETHGSAHA